VVVATTETDVELRQILQAIGAQRSFVACLRAPAEVVAERVERREPDSWPGKARLVEHARDLADAIPALEGVDAVIDTAGREPADVAGELFAALHAAGIV
jgi:chloramphenicol 3-O-phosphotransferase